MFAQNFVCPKGKTKEEIEKIANENGKACEGCRKNGTLENCCPARCPAYVGNKRVRVD